MNKVKGLKITGRKSKVPRNITKKRPAGNYYNASTIGNTDKVSTSILDKISSNEEIIKLFPDIDLAAQILVSSILAPNDLLETTLNYELLDSTIPNNVNTLLLDTVKIHIDTNYQLRDKLGAIIKEALFTKGAYAEVIMPIDTLEQLYNRSIKLSSESTMGFGPVVINKTFGKEQVSFTEDDLDIEFTDNIGVLTESMDALTALTGKTLSSEAAGNNYGAFKNLLKSKKPPEEMINISPTNDSERPLVMKVPINSVLPIHLTSDPSKHIGYILLLDDNGVPISKPVETDYTVDMLNGIIGNKDIKAKIIDKASKNIVGTTAKDALLSNVNEVYMGLAKDYLSEKLKASKLNRLVGYSEHSDFYKTVMFRAMKGLKTKMLYISKDNMSYFAYEYRENGTGKSLLEKSLMLFSIRASNLFSRVMANINNSITETKITANLDPDDVDPEATREKIIAESTRSNQMKYPIGLTNIRDLVDWMHKVGYRYDIKHPSLPNLDISIEDDKHEKPVPDSDFDEMIQEHIIMSFGLNAEMVKSGYDPEFATTVVANNVLFAKRVTEYQRATNIMLSEYVRKILKNDGILKNKLIDIITSNYKDIKRLISKSLTTDEKSTFSNMLNTPSILSEYIFEEYVEKITTTLPKVEISRQEGGIDGLDAFSSFIDTYLPMVISADTLPSDLVGDMSDKMDDITAAIKTILIKNWIDDHNAIPELTKFLTLDNTGKPRYDILEEYKSYVESATKAIIPHIKGLKKAADKTNDKLDKIENGEDDATDSGDSADSSDTSSTADSGTEDTSGSGATDTSSGGTGDDLSGSIDDGSDDVTIS